MWQIGGLERWQPPRECISHGGKKNHSLEGQGTGRSPVEGTEEWLLERGDPLGLFGVLLSGFGSRSPHLLEKSFSSLLVAARAAPGAGLGRAGAKGGKKKGLEAGKRMVTPGEASGVTSGLWVWDLKLTKGLGPSRDPPLGPGDLGVHAHPEVQWVWARDRRVTLRAGHLGGEHRGPQISASVPPRGGALSRLSPQPPVGSGWGSLSGCP